MANLHNLQAVVGISGTKAAVEALSASLAEVKFAYATDTGEIGVYSGGAWHWIGGVAGEILTDNDGNILIDEDGNVLWSN